MTLDRDDIEAIAKAIAKELREPRDSDARLTRAEAARSLGVSLSTFDRLRIEDKALRPVSTSPLRWSRRQLDLRKSRELIAVS